jgi:DNA-binding MurR/RpiR family transcriptional regulator
VQPRHIKLYYAGQAKNWRLAALELNELRGALVRVGRTIPIYRNISVHTAVASIFADTIKSVDAAIKAADPVQFSTAYSELMAASNTCYAGLEHPFVVIKVPGAPNYPDQEFWP